MNKFVYALGYDSPVLHFAAAYMQSQGSRFSGTATHILLPVPTPQTIEFSAVPDHATLIGGRLGSIDTGSRPYIDLLTDETYLAQNAAITAHCALKVALCHMEYTFQALPVLVIGWGRIGKCLTRLLRGLDADVTVATRKESDRAILRALGYRACDISKLSTEAAHFSLIFNTVPHPVLNSADCNAQAVLLELASTPGIAGPGVIDARGLPGKEAPQSSGELIGKTVLRLAERKEPVL